MDQHTRRVADIKRATLHEMSEEFPSRVDPPAGAQMPHGFAKKTAKRV